MTRVRDEDWKPQGVEGLESRAWDALRENTCSVSLTAGAGAGKTEFLAQKAAYLLQTGLCRSPKRILAISFKRDAAGNLQERVARRCSRDQADRFDSLTFDAFTKSLLDRFRLAIPTEYRPPTDYEIGFPSKAEIEDFLTRYGFHGVSEQRLRQAIERTKLPLSEKSNVLKSFWNARYKETGTVSLTFAMINRIAEWLLRENNEIRRAIQATYPFVFLDEFQDTTYAQYELLRTAFDGSEALFTAVGDDKQRIMVWAGAMENAFLRFQADFNARPLSLLCNFRSHKDLVRLQQVIAERIDPKTELPDARGGCEVDGDVSAIWVYADNNSETHGVASWVYREVQAGIAAHDFAILVRSKPENAEKELKPAFASVGLMLRNVARDVGGISIQDLLSEELTNVLIPLFQLGSKDRCPDSWTASMRSLALLEGVHLSDEKGQAKVERRLELIVRELRKKLSSSVPSKLHAERIATRILELLDVDTLRRAFNAYQRQSDFDRVWAGFLALLIECVEEATSWQEVIDKFNGKDQVLLMTVHKSKGLEFHTMIYFGLDSQTWWSLKPNNQEELNSFFVAFTRAKQRAFFTRSTAKGNAVTWIENLLVPAGVRRVRGPST